MRFLTILCAFVLILLLPVDGRCESDSLKFAFREKTISIQKSAKTLKITGILSNSSKNNLILYAFRKTLVLDSSLDSIFFSDIIKNGGAGTVLILLDKNGNRKTIHPEVCFDCEKNNGEDSHNPDYLTLASHKARNIYVETSEVLNARRTKSVAIVTSLENVHLETGEYKLYMIYYCGSEINDVVDPITAKKDETKYKAKLLRGWIKSDVIDLFVE